MEWGLRPNPASELHISPNIGGRVCLGSVVSRHVSNTSSHSERSRSRWVAISRNVHLPVSFTVSAGPEERYPHSWASHKAVGSALGPLLVRQNLPRHPGLRSRLLSGTGKDGGCKSKTDKVTCSFAQHSLFRPRCGQQCAKSPLSTHTSFSSSVG